LGSNAKGGTNGGAIGRLGGIWRTRRAFWMASHSLIRVGVGARGGEGRGERGGNGPG